MKIAIGPLLFGWPWPGVRDTYLSLAEEKDVDILYIGEVVCSKRSVSGMENWLKLAQELCSSGKEIVLSTLAMPITDEEVQAVRDLCQAASEMNMMVEANDMGAVSIASGFGVRFVAGPHLNVYNHGSLQQLIKHGACRLVMPLEMQANLIPGVAAESDVEVEYFAHGKLPLTFSARCYTARASGLTKKECRHVCFLHADGMEMRTLDAKDFSTINGIQIMSHHSFTVIDHLSDLVDFGVDILRLSPQANDMTEIIHQFRLVLDGLKSGNDSLQTLSGSEAIHEVFCNGYYHGQQGRLWVENP